MSDVVARAIGAGGSTIPIAGKECTVRPLGVRELVELERECLKQFKRDYLETFSNNLDLLPEDQRQPILLKKIDEVGYWTSNNLPRKMAYDPFKIKISPKLTAWLIKQWEVAEDTSVPKLQQITAASLDQEILTEAEYFTLTGETSVVKAKVPYVNWWVTGTFDGMFTTLWTCFREDGVTKEQVISEFSTKPALLNEIAREIERLSAPSVGNG
jgi:hypothetical protein